MTFDTNQVNPVPQDPNQVPAALDPNAISSNISPLDDSMPVAPVAQANFDQTVQPVVQPDNLAPVSEQLSSQQVVSPMQEQMQAPVALEPQPVVENLEPVMNTSPDQLFTAPAQAISEMQSEPAQMGSQQVDLPPMSELPFQDAQAPVGSPIQDVQNTFQAAPEVLQNSVTNPNPVVAPMGADETPVFPNQPINEPQMQQVSPVAGSLEPQVPSLQETMPSPSAPVTYDNTTPEAAQSMPVPSMSMPSVDPTVAAPFLNETGNLDESAPAAMPQSPVPNVPPVQSL